MRSTFGSGEVAVLDEKLGRLSVVEEGDLCTCFADLLSPKGWKGGL